MTSPLSSSLTMHRCRHLVTIVAITEILSFCNLRNFQSSARLKSFDAVFSSSLFLCVILIVFRILIMRNHFPANFSSCRKGNLRWSPVGDCRKIVVTWFPFQHMEKSFVLKKQRGISNFAGRTIKITAGTNRSATAVAEAALTY